MRWIEGLRARLRQLFSRRSADRRMDDEIRFHLEMEAAKNVRAGLSPEEARRRARLDFGGVQSVREQMRDERRLPVLEDLWRELAQALRSLRRNPGLTAAAALILALGVGANTAVFGLVNAVLLRPLPFPDSGRLVTLYQTFAEPGEAPRPVRWAYPEFEAVRAVSEAFPSLAAYYADDMNLAGGDEPVRVRTEMVSAGYFSLLGVPMARGRAFLPEEDRSPGSHPVAVLGHGLWQGAFGGDPDVLGRSVGLNGVALTVVGVAPAGFSGLTGDAEMWIPQAMAPSVYYADQLVSFQHFLSVVGRLAPGVDLREARAELATVGSRAADRAREGRPEPGEPGSWTVEATSLQEARRDPAVVRSTLVLAGAVLFVLLIATVNYSGLLLARSVGRTRERAIRAALGAGRARLLRQGLLESGLVGMLGGGFGLLAAAWSTSLLRDVALERLGASPGAGATGWQVEAFATPELDWRVATFALALAVLAGLAAGIAPTLRSTGGDLVAPLAAGDRGGSARVGSWRRPTALSLVTVIQVAVAAVLMVGAGVLLRGFYRLQTADPGFDASGVVTFRISPASTTFRDEEAVRLLQEILGRVRAVPGVMTASVGRCTPRSGDRCSSSYLIQLDRPEAEEPPLVRRDYVSSDHFRTLGIPLLDGRSLRPEDRVGSPLVAVVNRTAARRFWPRESPLGKRVRFTSGGPFAEPDAAVEIVGVVGDVVYGEPGGEVEPHFYTSYLQFTWAETQVMVRTTGDPSALVPGLRTAVSEVDPQLPIYDVRTAQERSADALAGERFATIALAVFALLGLLLGAVGIYGVMSYSVAQRRREVGIRMALGAARGEVLRWILGRGLGLTLLGLAVGSGLSLAVSRVLAVLVAGVGIADLVVLVAVLPLLLGVAVATCLGPAIRATRVDPVESLTAP